MSILGVLLLVIVLFGYALILLSKQLYQSVSSLIAKKEQKEKPISNFFLTMQHCSLELQSETFKQYAGYTALIFALWNFFAPDFGSNYGGLTLIGALVPSAVLLIDAFILNPQLLSWIPTISLREKLTTFLEQVSPIAGLLTLAIAIVHTLLYRLPFF